MQDFTTPLSDDEFTEVAKLKADLAGLSDVNLALRQQLHDEALNFLKQCVLAARHIEQMEDVFTARRIITDATIWALDLKKRLAKENPTLRRPRYTSDMFKR